MSKNQGSGWLTWLIVLILVVAGAGAGYWYWQHPREMEPEFRTSPVTRGELTQAVTATGQLNPVLNVQVGSQISGIISHLYVDFNSPVTNGQVIAQLDPATYKATVAQAQGELENSRAAAELAKIEARRADELFKAKLISDSDHDKAFADLHQADAQVTIKQASLDRAKVDLDRTTIFAPVDGVVISRNVDVGQTVAASLSAPTLFIIANDLSKMQIDASVSEADVGGVAEKQKVDFTVDAFPYRTFHGTVVQVRNAAATNQNVVTYDTVIGVDNKDLKLKPGMTANVSIIIAQREDALKIPNSALRFKPTESGDEKKAGGTNAPRSMAGAGGGESMGGGRQRGAGGAGGDGTGARGSSGAGGGRPGGGRPRGERSQTRTVYVLEAGKGTENETATLKPVQIKVGISDGAFTEVVEGLEENQQIVTGANVASGAAQRGTPNPFGGGMRRF